MTLFIALIYPALRGKPMDSRVENLQFPLVEFPQAETDGLIG